MYRYGHKVMYIHLQTSRQNMFFTACSAISLDALHGRCFLAGVQNVAGAGAELWIPFDTARPKLILSLRI